MKAGSVQNLLESFGKLYRFSALPSDSSSEEIDASDSEVYYAEYFDVRDAASARAALRERTMFGTRMRISSTSSSHPSTNEQSQTDQMEQDEYERPLLFTSLSPPPGLTRTANSMVPLHILPTTQPTDENKSQDHGRVRSHCGSTGNGYDYSPTETGTATPSSYSADGGPPASTPPTSPSVSPVDARRCSGGVFYDADVPTDVEHERATPPYYTSPPPQHQQPTPAPYFYNAPHYAPYYAPPLPLSPALPNAQVQAMHFPLPPVSTNYGYHPEPAGLGNWSWAPAPVPTPAHVGHSSHHGIGQHQQHAQGQNMGGGTTYYPVPMYYPPHHQHQQHQPGLPPFEDEAGFDQHQQHAYRSQYEEFFPHAQVQTQAPYAFRPSSSSSSPQPPPTQMTPAPEEPERRIHNAPCSAARAEKNQLDLGLIEQGLDTRTTVMVKNIPNKMSDKELIAYIEAVCPHKIDFLYLRMDFQNGCNVGYAFVNFIYVEDLLKFAKARLGIKWYDEIFLATGDFADE
ncbi:hypothetical protein HWV62_16056 [Athelia sp. TMB]|nr:hypothetical protein HWV62_16056 [Athelia sp. TMB]